MTSQDISRYRLCQQQVSCTQFENPGEVVAWLGAVQAQDYLGALWAVGLRTKITTVEASIEQAIADKIIVRTWPMRGTLHFVAPQDVRWMLSLTGARMVATHARRLKQEHGLDDITLARSKEVCIQVLEGGRQLSRNDIYRELEGAGISTEKRGIHILWRLAHDGLICFGPRDGKQQTFVLLDEWIPATKIFSREEALAELTLRYFTGHGPATIQDFVWWSGLTVTDAKTGLEMVKSKLLHESIDNVSYWMVYGIQFKNVESPLPITHLLPSFDEYLLGYSDRSAPLGDVHIKQITGTGNGLFQPIIVIDGLVKGIWKRTLKKDKVLVETNLFASLTELQRKSLLIATKQYGEFLGMPAELLAG